MWGYKTEGFPKEFISEPLVDTGEDLGLWGAAKWVILPGFQWIP